MHHTIGINGPHAPRHDFHLGLAQLAIQRVKLPVDVADADVIQINQRQRPDARPGQRLDRPRAHPAQADHANMRAPDTVKPLRPIQAANASRSAFHSGPSAPFSTKNERILPSRDLPALYRWAQDRFLPTSPDVVLAMPLRRRRRHSYQPRAFALGSSPRARIPALKARLILPLPGSCHCGAQALDSVARIA